MSDMNEKKMDDAMRGLVAHPWIGSTGGDLAFLFAFYIHDFAIEILIPKIPGLPDEPDPAKN